MIVLIIIDRLVAAKKKLLLPPFQLQCKSNKKDGEAMYNFNSFCYIRSMKGIITVTCGIIRSDAAA
jgi:hypothetical protein